MITNLQKQHVSQVASLHITGISTGFISSLGLVFVTTLYEAIAENDNSFGFIAFSNNLSKLYKYAAFKKGAKFAFVLAHKMFSLQRIKKIFETLFYPSRIEKFNNKYSLLRAGYADCSNFSDRFGVNND